MNPLRWVVMICLVVGVFVDLHANAQEANVGKTPKISWKRIDVDRNFRSEGVGVADVNKDGKIDIIVGDCWYEAPKDPAGAWKRHILRTYPDKDGKPVPADRKFDLLVYSKSFCCFPDDFNGDGYPDVIVIPFPGEPCYWYENPGAAGGLWKEHFVTNSACNETPIFVDLFKTGKKLLVMGWNPAKDDPKKGNFDDRGELCYFVPGKDPTAPWQRVSISGPSAKGKPQPGTARFSHGLGAGDVNGDGRVDVIVPQGWWEQPEKVTGAPWKFHAANITGACADMYAVDLDGDGKADIVSTSAHNYGFWWSKQNADGSFLQRTLFLPPSEIAKVPNDHGLSADELELFQAINAARAEEKQAPWAIHAALVAEARNRMQGKTNTAPLPGYPSPGPFFQTGESTTESFDLKKIGKAIVKSIANAKAVSKLYGEPNMEIGLCVERGKDNKGARYNVLIGTRGQFSLPSQTHALHHVDIDGDGLPDLVTGRRWWAHGPKGDAGPNDPAYVYWFQAKRSKDGTITYTPHVIDDDSGIGTSFAIADMNGDGRPDVIVANKKGVHVLLQVR